MRKSISLTDRAAEVALYLHPARMDLVSLLHEVCQLQREIAPLARIELHIEPQTLLMVADAKLLFSSLQQPAFLVSPLRFEVFNG